MADKWRTGDGPGGALCIGFVGNFGISGIIGIVGNFGTICIIGISGNSGIVGVIRISEPDKKGTAPHQ